MKPFNYERVIVFQGSPDGAAWRRMMHLKPQGSPSQFFPLHHFEDGFKSYCDLRELFVHAGHRPRVAK